MRTRENISPDAIKVYGFILAFVWTLIVLVSLTWNIHKVSDEMVALARNEASSLLNKDMGFRFWGTSHGGVYVPITDDTPPSPNLAHVPERDIQTPSGKQLTLMNPAYMMRQLMENYNDLFGTKGHLTGFKMLRAENAPDDWEANVLRRFTSEKISEFAEVTEIDGTTYMRMMRPMVMKTPCEKCHAKQGFHKGDLRGGVSISVPMEKYIIRQEEQSFALYGTHGGAWFFGLLLIGFGGRRLSGSLHETLKAQKEVEALNLELEQRVEDRTQALLEKEKRLRLTVENAADGIIVIDEYGTIETYNSSAGEIFGFSEQEVIGKNASVLLPKDISYSINRLISRYLRSSRKNFSRKNMKIQGLKKDGSVFPLSISLSEMRLNNSILFSAICRDLTIEQKIAAELMAAKKAAERANRAKSEFLASMSHELRTPLNSILGFAQLMELAKDKKLDGQQQDQLGLIQQGGRHLLFLINDILDLARIETQGFSLSMEDFDVQLCIHEAIMFVEPELDRLNLTLVNNASDVELPVVYGDETRFKQVLMNLLSNAVKYNRLDGSITIEAGVLRRLRSPEYCGYRYGGGSGQNGCPV